MKRVLVDTDIFIDFLRHQERAKDIFEGIMNEKIFAFSSVITEVELLSGEECEEREKRKAVDDLLSLTNRIEVNSSIAKISGDFRRKYKVPLMDAIVAATAFKLKSDLCSRNTKHYRKIKEIKLKVPY